MNSNRDCLDCQELSLPTGPQGPTGVAGPTGAAGAAGAAGTNGYVVWDADNDDNSTSVGAGPQILKTITVTGNTAAVADDEVSIEGEFSITNDARPSSHVTVTISFGGVTVANYAGHLSGEGKFWATIATEAANSVYITSMCQIGITNLPSWDMWTYRTSGVIDMTANQSAVFTANITGAFGGTDPKIVLRSFRVYIGKKKV